MRVPDGWIAENLDPEKSEGVLVQLTADQCASQPDTSGPQQKETPKINEETICRNPITVHERFDDIRELQMRLQEMSVSMNVLSQEMMECQRKLSKLIAGASSSQNS